MENDQKINTLQKTSKKRLLEGIHLHAIEGNPLTQEEIEMLLKFERENIPYEERIEIIRNTLLNETVQLTTK